MSIISRADPANQDVLILEVDGVFWRRVHLKIFGRRFRLKDLPLDELKEWIAEEEYQRAKNYLLYCLSLRGYFIHELQNRLKEYFVEDSIANRLIQEFCSYGYLDDQERLRSLIRSYQAKNQSPRAIKAKLFAKKIPRDLIEEGLTLIDPEESQESLKTLLIKKSKNLDLNDYKNKNKVIQFLMRKGFDYQDILEELASKKGF